MASLLSNYLGNRIIHNNFTSKYLNTDNVTYIALHSADPGVSGDLSTEIRGAGYERHPAYFSEGSAKTTANLNAMVFHDLRPVTVTHIAVWDRSDGGNMLIRMPLYSPVTIPASGNFVVSVGDIAFTL